MVRSPMAICLLTDGHPARDEWLSICSPMAILLESDGHRTGIGLFLNFIPSVKSLFFCRFSFVELCFFEVSDFCMWLITNRMRTF